MSLRKFWIFLLVIVQLGGFSCNNSTKNESNKLLEEKNNKDFKDLIHKTKKELIGADLFKAILDTITQRHLDIDLLVNSNWQFKVADDCIYTFKFKHNNIGENYNCEIIETYEIKYKIENDTLFVQEFEFSEIDSTLNNKRLVRNDKYIYNGESLIMVASITYYGGNKPRVPKIKEIIEYKRIIKH